jgi:hypothetical protein
MALDAPEDTPWWLGLFGLAFEALVNTMGVPGSGDGLGRRLREGFRPKVYFEEGAARFEAAIWLYQWAGVALDAFVFVATMIATRNEPQMRGKLARKVLPVGNLLDTFYGVGHFILFCVLDVKEVKEGVAPAKVALKYVQNTCAAIPEILKYLLLVKKSEILMPCDVIFNFASAALCHLRINVLHPARAGV